MNQKINEKTTTEIESIAQHTEEKKIDTQKRKQPEKSPAVDVHLYDTIVVGAGI